MIFEGENLLIHTCLPSQRQEAQPDSAGSLACPESFAYDRHSACRGARLS